MHRCAPPFALRINSGNLLKPVEVMRTSGSILVLPTHSSQGTAPMICAALFSTAAFAQEARNYRLCIFQRPPTLPSVPGVGSLILHGVSCGLSRIVSPYWRKHHPILRVRLDVLLQLFNHTAHQRVSISTLLLCKFE